VVDVESGELLAAHSDTRSYDSGKVIEGETDTLKPKGQILADLSSEISIRFANMISIHELTEQMVLEPGKGKIDLGRKYAETGMWSEAIDTWIQAAVEMPREPAVFYNLGIAYEINGRFDEADTMYRKALALDPKKRYMEAIVRLKNSRQDKARLEMQLMDMNSEDK
jgi:tetratricopeptide (TPR) repeat protein